jgi:hypothetical protein
MKFKDILKAIGPLAGVAATINPLVSASLMAVNAFFRSRGDSGEVALLKMLNSLQGAFYIALAERRLIP